MMNRFKLMKRQRGNQPVKNRIKNRSGVFRRKRIRGQGEDDRSPQKRRPPRTHKLRHHGTRGHSLPDFIQLWRRARIAPRLFSQVYALQVCEMISPDCWRSTNVFYRGAALLRPFSGPVPSALFHPVIRRLARDHYVVYVRFAQACRGDAHEPAPLAQFL